jgi:hypothetical protein
VETLNESLEMTPLGTVGDKAAQVGSITHVVSLLNHYLPCYSPATLTHTRTHTHAHVHTLSRQEEPLDDGDIDVWPARDGKKWLIIGRFLGCTADSVYPPTLIRWIITEIKNEYHLAAGT